MGFELFIGSRYLKAKQKQAFISLITILSTAGVTVGVMALIVVIAVMAGAQSEFRARILGVEAHAVLTRYGGMLANHESVVADILPTEGVVSAYPFTQSQIMLRSAGGVSGAILKGIVPEASSDAAGADGQAALSPLFADKGGASPSAEPPGIVLGEELARRLGVRSGDVVYIITPQGMLSPVGHVPSVKRLIVKGFFKSGMYQYDQAYAFVSLKDAQGIMRMGDSVTGIEIRVDDIYRADDIARAIESRLGFPYVVQDWMRRNEHLFSALKLEKTAMFIILTLIVLVAAFNIASTLIMMVMEKTKDIAILKAMGASNASIRRIFVYKGMVIGTLGTTLGVILGSLICELLRRYKFIELPGDVYYFTALPVQLQLMDVLVIAGASLLICFLATLYPAGQASKLNPVEAIRYG
jgi:lipoprotein-releasing system permease protein